jgi:hypothetical protein
VANLPVFPIAAGKRGESGSFSKPVAFEVLVEELFQLVVRDSSAHGLNFFLWHFTAQRKNSMVTGLPGEASGIIVALVISII